MATLLNLFVICIVMKLSLQAGTPTILITDLGGDNDDNWAIGLLQNLDYYDLKLVVVDSFNTINKAHLAAKQLDLSDWGHIPIAIGPSGIPNNNTLCIDPWGYDYKLENYPGEISWDSAASMAQVINENYKSNSPIQILVIGACPTIPLLIKNYPETISKCKVANMGGNLHSSSAEYNINGDISAAQALYQASWYEPMLNAPFTPTSEVVLGGDIYTGLLQNCANHQCQTVLQTQYYFANNCGWGVNNIATQSKDPLFDPVTIWLASSYGKPYAVMKQQYIKITDAGVTEVVSEGDGNLINVLSDWSDLSGFEQWFAETLSNNNKNTRKIEL